MNDCTPKFRLAAAVAVALLGLAAPAAVPMPARAQQQQAAPVTEPEMKAFATATKDIDKINRDYRARIKAAPDSNAGQKLQIESLDEIAKAIQANGLTVERYTQIAQAVKNDAAVRERVRAYMQQ
jgi:hypothetical protein